MDGLDNYIYYSICEKSYEVFNKGSDTILRRNVLNCITYGSFCTLMQNSIKLNDFSKGEIRHISFIKEYIMLIYGLTSDESMEYIYNYFADERYVYLEESVRLMSVYFKI